MTKLEQVCQALRERLTPYIQDLDMNKQAADTLEQFLQILINTEKSLLPRKKQRALEEMTLFIQNEQKKAIDTLNQVDVDHLHAIYEMLTKPNPYRQPDWDEVAAKWLDLIRPVWFERLKSPRNRPLLLKDIRKDLINNSEFIVKRILEEFRNFPVLPTPDERISACIIGVN